MKHSRPMSCLMGSLIVLSFIAVAFGFLLWLNTGNVEVALRAVAAALLVFAGVFLWFWIPIAIYAAGRYLGGRMAGMVHWHTLVGLFQRIDRGDGRRITRWSLTWGGVDCVMRPTTMQRPLWQLKRYNRGGIYGAMAAVLVLAGLGALVGDAVGNMFVVLVALLPTVVLFQTAHRLTFELDRASGEESYAAHCIARIMLAYDAWTRKRPREWCRESIEVWRQPVQEPGYRMESLLSAFAYYNDVPDGADDLKAVVAAMQETVSSDSISERQRRNAREMLAYYAADCLRDAGAAREWLEGNIEVDDRRLVSWHNAALQALFALEGKRDEAQALGERMTQAAKGHADHQYVFEQTQRVVTILG